jgi:hypothetical protein
LKTIKEGIACVFKNMRSYFLYMSLNSILMDLKGDN